MGWCTYYDVLLVISRLLYSNSYSYSYCSPSCFRVLRVLRGEERELDSLFWYWGFAFAPAVHSHWWDCLVAVSAGEKQQMKALGCRL